MLYEHANIHQSHSQNDSGDLRGVAGGDGKLGCLYGKAGTSHLCDGSAHSSGCVVNGSNVASFPGLPAKCSLYAASLLRMRTVMRVEGLV